MPTKLTAKQHAFCLAYLETGNATEAYRRAYNAGGMASRTIKKRASELMANGDITGTIGELQNKAAEQAVLNRAWVLQRLMKNAQVSLGEQTLKLRVQRKNRDTGAVEVSELEVSAHDAQAANRALELLGKTEEVSLFVERHEHTGKDGGPIKTTEVQLTDIERARRIAFILQRAEKALQEQTQQESQH